MRNLLVAMLVVLAMVSVASAGSYVWFTSGGLGGEGQKLILPAPGVYEVAVNLRIGAGDYLSGYDIGLMGPAGDSAVVPAVTAQPGVPPWIANWSANPPPNTGNTDFNSGGAGPTLFHFAQSGAAYISGGPYAVATFTLTAVQGDIMGGSHIGGYGWGDATGGLTYPVQIGLDGNWIDGVPGSYGTLPAITVLPEPGTLMLLGLGLVGLLRRR